MLGLILLAGAASGRRRDGSRGDRQRDGDPDVPGRRQAGDRRSPGNWAAGGTSGSPVIELDPGRKYQTIVGFGGAFTESSAHVLQQLSPALRDSVIDAYFSRDGAGLQPDPHAHQQLRLLAGPLRLHRRRGHALASFSIAHDLEDLVPLIKDAMNAPGADFRIIASPWTAPPWMKDNDSWYGGSLKPGMEDVWARYLVKYLDAYRERGIDIWGLTPENEPLGNNSSWDSMHFTPEEHAGLHPGPPGPAAAGGRVGHAGADLRPEPGPRGGVGAMSSWATPRPRGTSGARRSTGTAAPSTGIPRPSERVHEAFPDKHLLHSEGCVDTQVPVWQDDDWYWRQEATDWGFHWAQEENKHRHRLYVPVYRYARDIIGGLNSWLYRLGRLEHRAGYAGRSQPGRQLVLRAGHRQAGNRRGLLHALYYTLAHFSKYLRPGARRIGVENGLGRTHGHGRGESRRESRGGRPEPARKRDGLRAARWATGRSKLSIPAAAIQTVIVVVRALGDIRMTCLALRSHEEQAPVLFRAQRIVRVALPGLVEGLEEEDVVMFVAVAQRGDLFNSTVSVLPGRRGRRTPKRRWPSPPR